jgi:hypothetical protein
MSVSARSTSVGGGAPVWTGLRCGGHTCRGSDKARTDIDIGLIHGSDIAWIPVDYVRTKQERDRGHHPLVMVNDLLMIRSSRSLGCNRSDHGGGCSRYGRSEGCGGERGNSASCHSAHDDGSWSDSQCEGIWTVFRPDSNRSPCSFDVCDGM